MIEHYYNDVCSYPLSFRTALEGLGLVQGDINDIVIWIKANADDETFVRRKSILEGDFTLQNNTIALSLDESDFGTEEDKLQEGESYFICFKLFDTDGQPIKKHLKNIELSILPQEVRE